MKLSRTPDFDVATATLNGTWSAPVLIVTPPATTRPTPSGVMLGPIPNSLPAVERRLLARWGAGGTGSH